MEFDAKFIEENQLNDEQISAISKYVDIHTNEQIGAKVNEHTEKTLENVWSTVNEMTGIQRNQGEKYADALNRASGLYLKTQKENLALRQAALEEKIANTKGDESLKSRIKELEESLQPLKQKAALYDEWEKEDYKGKFETSSKELNANKQRMAFAMSRPSKPEHVNPYEWDAKMKDFEKKILTTNKIVFDEDNTAWAVSMENEFTKHKITDLYKEDQSLQELMRERQVTGLGSGSRKDVTIDGLPFKLPENATSTERNEAIRKHLQTVEKIDMMSNGYSERFNELNQIAMGLKKKSANSN